MRVFRSLPYGTFVKTGLLIAVAALASISIWEAVCGRYEVYDISSTSNCCACKLTVVILDTWTGITEARSLPSKPISEPEQR